MTAWLDARGQAWKDSVQVVAMDPRASNRAAVREALPQARIVADHFHLVRLANQAVTDVRRRVTWDTHGRRGRKTDPAWAARRRLLRGWERLSPAQFTKMWNDLVDGDPSNKILTAWIAKEELRRLLATARTGGQRHDVAHRLHRFNSWCAQSVLVELERLAGTIEAWWPEVLGFLQTGVTNAGTEATNRTVKTAHGRPTGSGTWRTNAAEYGSPAPDDHAGAPPAEVNFPLKFEEPSCKGRPCRAQVCRVRSPAGRAALHGVVRHSS